MGYFLLQILFVIFCGIFIPGIVILGSYIFNTILEKIKLYREKKIEKSVDFELSKFILKFILKQNSNLDLEQIKISTIDLLSKKYNYEKRKDIYQKVLEKNLQFYQNE